MVYCRFDVEKECKECPVTLDDCFLCVLKETETANPYADTKGKPVDDRYMDGWLDAVKFARQKIRK